MLIPPLIRPPIRSLSPFVSKLTRLKPYNVSVCNFTSSSKVTATDTTHVQSLISKPKRNSSQLPTVKPTTPSDTYVSCTILDSKGNVTALSRRFPKMQFLHEHGLYPRDLRKIDTSIIDIIPSIAVRENCILVNLLHIKALVEANKVLIFDTSDPVSSSRLGLFVYDLEAKLQMPATATNGWMQQYEHKALESILINVMGFMEAELKDHLRSCGRILADLENEIDRDKLRALLIRSKNLSAFYQKAVLIRDVIDDILDNDEDLLGMYLTDKLDGDTDRERRRLEEGEVEMLLEAYYKQSDEFVQQSESLLNDIKSTEEIVNIILDANRNSLMLFELKITIYTLGFTVATMLPAFYGMNLKNFIESSDLGFGGVVVFSMLLGLMITSANFKRLKAVQKLSLMNHDAKMNSKNTMVQSAAKWDKFKFWRRGRSVRDVGQRDVVWKWLIDEKKK
ncbi:hypothetical protein WICPIJ_000423 [Wickerhamomyces pijperi]|uniref:Magnesium transporter n=1 Tax=Wickerhamomyces pijperi TaxID=599730 RepID=A0A9P8TS18_WICPI|nr:hypothetical protein WICPIJ_000423 [Wickerhamomyces pijperi]